MTFLFHLLTFRRSEADVMKDASHVAPLRDVVSKHPAHTCNLRAQCCCCFYVSPSCFLPHINITFLINEEKVSVNCVKQGRRGVTNVKPPPALLFHSFPPNVRIC